MISSIIGFIAFYLPIIIPLIANGLIFAVSNIRPKLPIFELLFRSSINFFIWGVIAILRQNGETAAGAGPNPIEVPIWGNTYLLDRNGCSAAFFVLALGVIAIYVTLLKYMDSRPVTRRIQLVSSTVSFAFVAFSFPIYNFYFYIAGIFKG